MGTLIEAYEQVSKQVSKLGEKLKRTEEEIARLSMSFAGDTSGRIEKLTEQLQKIDEYLLKIKGFQALAQKNMDSQNVLTIEAPPGYRVNLNRLRNWAMMIDPTSANDPYAQRVYVVAKCDQRFLEQKQEEFKERIAMLKEDQAVGTSHEIETLKGQLSEIKNELKQYAAGPEMTEFAKRVVAENSAYWYQTAPAVYQDPSSAPAVVVPGALAAPLDFEPEQRQWLKAVMGAFYDENGGRVLLPAEINGQLEYVMAITCVPTKRKRLDKALQNLILGSIHENPVGVRKIYVLDGVRFNSSCLGSLRQLEGTFALEPIPRNPDQLTTVLEQIVSSFSDIDEFLELHDSMAEYNNSVTSDKRLPMSTIVAIGWPGAFEGRDRELFQRILTNYERYGISLITVTYQNTSQKGAAESEFMPEYAAQNAIRIQMLQNGDTITFPGKMPQYFVWYMFQDTLLESYAESLMKHKKEKHEIGNEYIKRYPLTRLSPYVRTYKKIELPFGVDGKDQAHSISFENENFATYLVGASRSGKSTLLHTLIAGLIRNYHPDNVELWLADFKQLEFKRYINHLPPHVKYILLDESTELVYDLIDRLTAEMMERQKLFSRLGKQRIDQVDPTTLDKPLPVIFVILDEFSIMSQSIAESPVYKLRLQNILAKGAALGIKFLFSSQTFTTGVAGLTATARAQIQQRIAMKGSKEEISETLELSANMKTEQVRNWMDALPPHYALIKFRAGADSLPQVKRFLVMYFKDYAPRDDMIESIRSSMHAVEDYQPSDVTSYCDKHPVLVDGNTFDAFNCNDFKRYVDRWKRARRNDLSGGEMFIGFGTPRLMVKTKPAVLSAETRENILLIARAAEQACAASVLLSAIKSYQAQDGEVQIWAYGKNRLYRTYREIFTNTGAKIIEDIDAVCNEIRSLKKALANKMVSNTLIVLIGIDRICMDFEFVDQGGNPAVYQSGWSAGDLQKSVQDQEKELVKRGAVATTSEEEERAKTMQKWLVERKRLITQLEAEGRPQDGIKSAVKAAQDRFFQTAISSATGAQSHADEKAAVPAAPEKRSAERVESSQSGAYNAVDDFAYVLKQGSRLGYHFAAAFNSYSDVKLANLKMDWFRHRLAFQVSSDDSIELFGKRIASSLPLHICQYSDSLDSFSFRPYLHRGITWDGWEVDENDNAIDPY